MANKKKLLDDKFLLTGQIQEIVDRGKAEQRMLNADEEKKVLELQQQVRSIELELSKDGNTSQNTQNTQKMPQFRFLSLINDKINNTISEENAEYIERSAELAQKVGIYNATAIAIPLNERAIVGMGADYIPSETLEIIDALRAKLVLSQAGATIYTGLSADLKLPRYSGSGATWEGEVVEQSDKAGTFDYISLKPKRLVSTIKVPKSFLMQMNAETEAYLRNEIVSAIACKLESTIFDNATIAGAPTGLFTGTSATATFGVMNGALSYKNLLKMEAAVDGANAMGETPAYITTPLGKAILRSTPIAANAQRFIAENDSVGGYKLLSTSNMKKYVGATPTEEGVVFGNFRDLIIGGFGVMNIETENKPRENAIYLTINSFWDVAKRHNESFAIGSFKDA